MPLIIDPQHNWAILQHLAGEAKPIDQFDYGSGRQIDAQNDFAEAVEALVPPGVWETISSYWLKATPEEGIEYALAAARPHVLRTNPVA